MKKLRRAVFFDRDGTLMQDKGYLGDVSGIALYRDTVPVLKRLSRLGFLLIAVSNQSGIGRGLITHAQVRAIHRDLAGRLKRLGVKLAAIYYCPHGPDANCSCRKPNIAMIQKAEKRFGIDLKNSVIVGDKLSDIELGANAGMRSMLVLTGRGKRERAKSHDPRLVVARNLSHAASLIERGLSSETSGGRYNVCR